MDREPVNGWHGFSKFISIIFCRLAGNKEYKVNIMNLRSLSLIALLIVLLFVALKVLADVRAERIKVNVNGPCVEKIEEAAQNIEGVIQTNWDSKKGELEIIYEEDKISLQEIEEAISEAGFNTPNFKAPEEVSARIPRECRVKQAITILSNDGE